MGFGSGRARSDWSGEARVWIEAIYTRSDVEDQQSIHRRAASLGPDERAWVLVPRSGDYQYHFGDRARLHQSGRRAPGAQARRILFSVPSWLMTAFERTRF